MKWRNTILVLIVFALLAGYVYFFEMRKKEPETTPEEEEKIVFQIPQDDVVELIVESDEGKRTRLVKEGEEPWKMVEPAEEEADTRRVDAMVFRFVRLKANGFFTATAESLADYGLGVPKLTAKAVLKDKSEKALLVGNKTPNKANYYMMKKDVLDRIYLVESTFGDDLWRLITEPPKKPTPTPTATITPTPEITGTVEMEGEATPEATGPEGAPAEATPE